MASLVDTHRHKREGGSGLDQWRKLSATRVFRTVLDKVDV